MIGGPFKWPAYILWFVVMKIAIEQKKWIWSRHAFSIYVTFKFAHKSS